jgi:hypothetical protein
MRVPVDIRRRVPRRRIRPKLSLSLSGEENRGEEVLSQDEVASREQSVCLDETTSRDQAGSNRICGSPRGSFPFSIFHFPSERASAFLGCLDTLHCKKNTPANTANWRKLPQIGANYRNARSPDCDPLSAGNNHLFCRPSLPFAICHLPSRRAGICGRLRTRTVGYGRLKTICFSSPPNACKRLRTPANAYGASMAITDHASRITHARF